MSKGFWGVAATGRGSGRPQAWAGREAAAGEGDRDGPVVRCGADARVSCQPAVVDPSHLVGSISAKISNI
jgi:hypothetical protein